MDRNQLLHQFYQEYPRGRYWVLYCSCSISMTWLIVPSLKVVLHLYADDLLLYKVITCPEDYTTLQSDINSVASWITQHHLSFNTSKCKCMTVTRLQQNSVSPPVLQLNGKPMENVTSYKYLGVTLTSDLTWSDHIHNITRKARRLTGMLYRQFSRLSSPTALFMAISICITSETPSRACCSCMEPLSHQRHQLP